VSGRPWTDLELLEALDLRDQGLPLRSVARRLKRSEAAVKNALLRHGATNQRIPLYTLPDIAELMGTTYRRVQGWQRYALPVQTKQRRLLVPWLDLMEWLEEPAHYMMYDPVDCTEATLREHLVDLHRDHGGWVNVATIAAWHRVSVAAVQRWVRRGDMVAVEYENRYWVERRIVEAFVIPSER
jgi:hypothetical protein